MFNVFDFSDLPKRKINLAANIFDKPFVQKGFIV